METWKTKRPKIIGWTCDHQQAAGKWSPSWRCRFWDSNQDGETPTALNTGLLGLFQTSSQTSSSSSSSSSWRKERMNSVYPPLLPPCCSDIAKLYFTLLMFSPLPPLSVRPQTNITWQIPTHWLSAAEVTVWPSHPLAKPPTSLRLSTEVTRVFPLCTGVEVRIEVPCSSKSKKVQVWKVKMFLFCGE